MQFLMMKDSAEKLTALEEEIKRIKSQNIISFMDYESIGHLEREYSSTRKRLKQASIKRSREAYLKKGYKYNGNKKSTYEPIRA